MPDVEGGIPAARTNRGLPEVVGRFQSHLACARLFRRAMARSILAMAIFGFVVMSLWNWLMPTLFGGHTIGYWQAWGIIILSKILFGGQAGRDPAAVGDTACASAWNK